MRTRSRGRSLARNTQPPGARAKAKRVAREVVRYAVVSAIALGCDVVLLAILATSGVAHVPASAIAYMAGLGVHYALATRFVFRHRLYSSRAKVEFAIYAAIGLVGLVLTAAIVRAGDALDVSLAVSKTVAVIVSFVAQYLLRRFVLFRVRHDRASDA
jgi:putative flippase GtrA